MAKYDWIAEGSPCKSCQRKEYKMGGLSRCVDFRRYGKEITIRGQKLPRLLRCSLYIGPHRDKHFPGFPYYETVYKAKRGEYDAHKTADGQETLRKTMAQEQR